GPDLDALDLGAPELRREVARLEPGRDRRAAHLELRGLGQAQLRLEVRRELARDADVAQAVPAVRRELDFEDRVVEAEHIGERLAERSAGGKHEDALGLL